MEVPLYSLGVVKEAVRDRRFYLAKERAQLELLAHFDTVGEVHAFTQAIVNELEGDDFAHKAQLPKPPHDGLYDVYGRRISPELTSRFGLAKRCWYLKLRLLEPEAEWLDPSVFFISLHVLEKDLWRRGGLLKAEV